MPPFASALTAARRVNDSLSTHDLFAPNQNRLAELLQQHGQYRLQARDHA
jgi:hypothetical protein